MLLDVSIRQTRKPRSAAFRPQRCRMRPSTGFLEGASAFGHCCGLKAALLWHRAMAEMRPGRIKIVASGVGTARLRNILLTGCPELRQQATSDGARRAGFSEGRAFSG